MTKTSRHVVALYMPVYHKGYSKFLKANKDAEHCYVFDNDLLESLDYIKKDIRAISPEEQVRIIKGLGMFKSVKRISWNDLSSINTINNIITMPDEDISIEVAKKLKKARVNLYPIFLRWHRNNVDAKESENEYSTALHSEINKKFMKEAYQESQKSSDIWRHVGAIISMKDTKEDSSFNSTQPSAHSSWMEGDPRNLFKRGVRVEMSTFLHAEAKLIARAAKEGTSLKGANIYVTTFPCPACAKLIAESGIKCCYFSEGYAVLDGARVLKQHNVKIIRLKDSTHKNDARRLEKYKFKT